jgi:hypothetical protein
MATSAVLALGKKNHLIGWFWYTRSHNNVIFGLQSSTPEPTPTTTAPPQQIHQAPAIQHSQPQAAAPKAALPQQQPAPSKSVVAAPVAAPAPAPAAPDTPEIIDTLIEVSYGISWYRPYIGPSSTDLTTMLDEFDIQPNLWIVRDGQDVFEISFARGPNGLGFSIAGGTDHPIEVC